MDKIFDINFRSHAEWSTNGKVKYQNFNFFLQGLTQLLFLEED